MTPSPRCLLRGFINTIHALTSYNAHDWVHPKLWFDGSFTIFLPFVDGTGHEDIELIAEAATRFENEFNLPNGTISIRFFSKTGIKFSTITEVSGPYTQDLPRFSKHLFDVHAEWYTSCNIDESIEENIFEYQERDDGEINPRYIYEIDEEKYDVEYASISRQTTLFAT